MTPEFLQNTCNTACWAVRIMLEHEVDSGLAAALLENVQGPVISGMAVNLGMTALAACRYA